MWHLLTAHQQESFLPFSSRQSLLLPKPRGKKEHSKTTWSSLLSFRTVWSFLFTPDPRGSLPFTLEPHGPLPFPSEPCSSLSLWLPPLGLNPSAHLPLQPHFRLLLQSVTPASIPVFFQLYWAAIVSLGRCGPMAWSQLSPSSHAGPVTRGSCLPVPPWVEVTPISLAQSMATAIQRIYETS